MLPKKSLSIFNDLRTAEKKLTTIFKKWTLFNNRLENYEINFVPNYTENLH